MKKNDFTWTITKRISDWVFLVKSHFPWPDGAIQITGHDLNLDTQMVLRLLNQYQVEPWFSYILINRSQRWDISETESWLKAHLPRTARILETGCGVGFTLLWLAQNGFTHLSGFDIAPNYIQCAKALALKINSSIQYRVWDGAQVHLYNSSSKYSAIISLNWIFLVPGYSYEKFFNTYSQYLSSGGILVIDAIDSSYNGMKNNQYLTSDWAKAPSLRKPSEYKLRINRSEIVSLAQIHNLQLIHSFKAKQQIPKYVYFFKRN